MLRCNMREAKDNDKWQKKIVTKVTTPLKQFQQDFNFLDATANTDKGFSLSSNKN